MGKKRNERGAEDREKARKYHCVAAANLQQGRIPQPPRMEFQFEHAVHLRSNAPAMQNLNLFFGGMR
jgi:hypothetical protein